MKLSTLIGRTKQATIDFGDGDLLHYVYRPAAITGKMVIAINSLTETVAIADFCADAAAVLASWDLLGEDGEPVPITPESLQTIPWGVLCIVFNDAMSKAGEVKAAQATGA